ncbi:MAG: hypothetical protein ACKV2U_20235 [Bryobacteraceae bacterium]
MTKLHVFVNKQGEVMATGPAPDEFAGKTPGDGPMFVGFSPANGADDMKAFEIEVDSDFMISRRNPNVDEFHARVANVIRTNKDLKQVNFQR